MWVCIDEFMGCMWLETIDTMETEVPSDCEPLDMVT